MIPSKLRPGDEIRVIAPSMSYGIINDPFQRKLCLDRFASLGLKVSFGAHVESCDLFQSSSVEARLQDLHLAFATPAVKAIFTAIGGFNANQLLKDIDYDLIRGNPKIFCGYSDITALQNALFCKTGLVTYSGPHYSTFGMLHGFEYTLDYFQKCFFSSDPFEIRPSTTWSDDPWYLDQEKREFRPNEGYSVIHPGEAEGTLIGGNLSTLALLQGTPFMPSLNESILFIEEDNLAGDSTAMMFDRYLQSLIHLPDFSGVRALLIGRFQKLSDMTLEKMTAIINSKKELGTVPVIYGMDFGHTSPYLTLPIGGTLKILAKENNTAQITTLVH